jgi:hypothetical protein
MDYTNLCAHARTSQFRERRKAEIAIDGQPRSYVIERPTMADLRPLSSCCTESMVLWSGLRSERDWTKPGRAKALS